MILVLKPEFLTYMVLLDQANSIAPGKRMLSSMTPTVVEKTENYLWW
jgi:gamma-glutamyltranspeptidase